ncbi:MAG: hypothetical protein DRO04_00205 [Candidatus Iainarchaeum archaeon]|uniref:Uncharacterized protein n=1 Tax=Candidatus Iainarchaeum sp. TaxID=3101447 RepID=A0A497JI49_9ARCH|nr:MAG: hypothetical protein DRO04_00205 [Candidatus Diapherotrites archaeon]
MRKEAISAVILLVCCYIVLYVLSFFLHSWESPFYFLLPIPGFLFAYLFSGKLEDFIGYKNPWVLLIGFIFLGILAYYINLHWYYYNMYYLLLQRNPQLEKLGMNFGIYLYGGKLNNGQYFNGIGFDFLAHLKNEPFIVFLLSAVFGYIAYKLKPRLLAKL